MSATRNAKARKLIDAKKAHTEASKAAEAAEKKFKAAQAEFWMDLDEAKEKSVTLELGEGYGTVSFGRRETITGRILNAEMAEAAIRKLGLDDAILAETHNVRKKVLNEHVRSMMERGDPLPQGVDFNATRYVVVSKKKG